MRPELRANVAAQGLQRFRARRAIWQKAFGETHRTEGERGEALDDAVDTEHQFERSTPDVGNDGAPRAELEMRQCAAEAQASLFLAIEDADVKSRLTVYAMQEILAIPRVAHGARRDRLDPLRAKLASERRHVRDRFDRAAHRVIRQ